MRAIGADSSAKLLRGAPRLRTARLLCPKSPWRRGVSATEVPVRGTSRRPFARLVDAGLVLPGLEPHRKAPELADVCEHFSRRFGQRPTAVAMMPKRQRAVAVAIVAD